MNFCHVCGCETESYGEMEPGRGVLMKCVVCKVATRPAVAPAPPTTALATESVAAIRPASPTLAATAAAPITASGLIDAARVRRAAVAVALAEMTSLQTEAALLDRILSAVEPLN
jgi:hypothetical protein